MEAIIILLLLLPLAGYILQNVGIGKTKTTELLLPVISPEMIRSALIDFTRSHSWSLLVEEPTSERLLYVFKAGQFGFSKDGAQIITVTFFPTDKEVKCFIKSESLLGQFYDFDVNQKNIESLAFFLSETTKHSEIPESTTYTPIFLHSKPTVNVKYWVFLVTLLILIIGSRALYTISREVVPGTVEITFQSYVTDDIAQKLMIEFGAINCRSIDKIKTYVYECDAPVGEEEKVAATARSNAVVSTASPKYVK